jgi:hypothetical protein
MFSVTLLQRMSVFSEPHLNLYLTQEITLKIQLDCLRQSRAPSAVGYNFVLHDSFAYIRSYSKEAVDLCFRLSTLPRSNHRH